jgi:hypothetical protein
MYKFLSNGAASTGVMVLPDPTITIGGSLLTSTIPSGFTIDTADVKSLSYTLSTEGGVPIGAGRGNFTSKNLTFRWKYIDPTGGIIDSIEKMLENPFLDLPPDISVQVLDEGGQALTELIKPYDRFSYTITLDDNKRLVSRDLTNWTDVQPTRTLGLKVVVTDNTKASKTGTYYAYNIRPSYPTIDVIDSYQNSPYYILSGYYGHSTFTGLAVWGSGANGILGSGLRNYTNGQLLRSEDETREIVFEDISGAFIHATGLNGTSTNSPAIYKGIGINYRGLGAPDYLKYVLEGGTIDTYGYYSTDLIDYYNDKVRGSMDIKVWGSGHYEERGQFEQRVVPRIAGNPLGLADLSKITQANKTGFSGISFTVFTEEISKGEIIFNCYSSTSNKDVWSVDIYTGDNANFNPDIIGNTNFLYSVSLYKTRSYLNEIRISQGLKTGVWHYFRFVPWDDFGPGVISSVVSGYLEEVPVERTVAAMSVMTVDGGRDQFREFEPTPTSLVKGFKYQIKVLGGLPWASIGVTTSPAIDVEFIYNGANFSPNGARVRRVEIPIALSEEDLDKTLIVDAETPSTLVLPADIPDGTVSCIVNRGDEDLVITDSLGEQISVIHPGERADIIKADEQWYDPRGSSLYLE